MREQKARTLNENPIDLWSLRFRVEGAAMTSRDHISLGGDMTSESDMGDASPVQSLTIHAVSVGDGILALAQAPGKSGDYKGDLQHIGEWRPSIVISMTTRVEHLILDIETLGSDIQSLGSRWLHFPVEDFSTPSEEMDARWSEISTLARSALRGGGRVLVHCNGGCGRSGMAALRLMIESGEAPDQALRRLRNQRPCAVETPAQLEWARAAVQTGD